RPGAHDVRIELTRLAPCRLSPPVPFPARPAPHEPARTLPARPTPHEPARAPRHPRPSPAHPGPRPGPQPDPPRLSQGVITVCGPLTAHSAINGPLTVIMECGQGATGRPGS